MTHTPGPWKPGYRNINVTAVNAKIGGEVPVCDIRGWGYLTGKGHGALGLPHDEAVAIQEANARLIAAAPDFLEAAEMALRDAVADEQDPWFAALKAAVDKAKG